MDKKIIKVYTTSNGAELNISAPSIKQTISATNNRAQYYSEQAKKYRDEAKYHRDNAQYYSEQNADVTIEYVNTVKANLEEQIATKQIIGDYALREDLPKNVSELENDAQYIDNSIFEATVEELRLPSDEGCSGYFLTTNGDNKSWVDIKALNKSQITNCLLEVPQRIKLELADGVLTLKAGSEVIVPNGFEDDGTTPKFDYVTLTKDLSYSATWGNGYRCFLIVGNSGLGMCREDYVASESTEPTAKGSGYIWYDTTNNIIKRYNGTNWFITQDCFFIGIVTIGTGNVITSIDQVFNGIGYIGSTIWVDKGVKCLVPNGRNEDGTLNNIEYTVESLRTVSQTASNSNLRRLFMGVGNWGACFNYNYFEGKDGEQPTTTATAARIYYAYDTNIVYISPANTTTWEKRNFAQLCELTCSTTALLTLSPKTTFRAVDYNDKQDISGWGMPSGKYIDLTLGNTGADYIAPANGWVTIGKKNSGAGQLVEIRNISSADLAFRSEESTSNRWVMTSCPVKRGDTFRVVWTAGGELGWFRFVYAQGEV